MYGKGDLLQLFTLRHLHVLFDLVKVKKRKEMDGPARKYEDYEVLIDKDNAPKGVELIEKPWKGSRPF